MPPKTASRIRAAGREISRPPDPNARYARLFEEFERPAKGMVRRAFGSAFSDDELDDLYSSAWLSTLAAFDRKPRELPDEDLRRYVFTAVANQASRELRRRGRRPTLPMESAFEAADPDAGPDELASRTEETELAREVLGSLPPRRRAVMVFRYGWGLEPDEVCGIVENLSPRAYRKEVERGVAEVARKMRLVEAGEWCDSREPLLRAVAAGTATEEEERQARQHLSHCRSCTSFLGKLNGHLHDLGTPLALTVAGGSLPLGGTSILGRIVEALERVAGPLIPSGGTGGAGVAGAGAMGKLAGLGAVPKLVAACVGTGAAATACMVAGVVPGVGGEREPSNRTAIEARDQPRDRSDLRRHQVLAAISAPSDAPEPPPTDGLASQTPPSGPAEPAPNATVEEPPPPPPASPSPTAQDFEPVGTAVQPAAAPASTSTPSGGGTGDAAGGDFGP